MKVLKEKKNAKIGLVGLSFMPMNFYQYLVDHLPGAEFVDMTEQIDHVKVVKSAEEIELIKATAALQDCSDRACAKSHQTRYARL